MTREREGSDGESSGSLEEISADDFKQQSSVWMRYPSQNYPTVSRNYAPSLYSFAWAQAVQNKPLVAKQEEVEEGGGEEEGGENVGESEGCDDEKEEGELEEGEIELGLGFGTAETEKSEKEKKEFGSEMIDLDSDAPERESKESEEIEKELSKDEIEKDESGDFDQKYNLILEEIEHVSIEEAEKSFESTCSRLKTSFESLKQLYTEMGNIPLLDPLIQQAFAGIKTLISVLDSDKFPRREQNKQYLLRMLIHIKNQYASMLPSERLDELQSDVQSLAFKGEEQPKSKDQKKPILPKLEISSFNRPIIDLHMDYDENSLPSPTRTDPIPLPIPKPIGFTPIIPPNNNNQNNAAKLHPYVTEAFKAVSSYQQRFYGNNNRNNNVFATDDLPSPTPSEEERKGSNTDSDFTTGEVSSSSPVIPPPKPTQPVLNKQSALKPVLKSRDPRLRFVKPENEPSPNPNPNPRKNKAVAGSLINESRVKKQRDGSGKGGWLEESTENNNNNNNNNNKSNNSTAVQSSNSVTPAVSLPTLLKDIAVNPTMLVQLLQLDKQKRSSSDSQPKPVIPVSKPVEPVPIPVPSARVIQPPVPVQTNSTGSVRMKPRDPRRILHANSGPDPVRPTGSGPDPVRPTREKSQSEVSTSQKVGADVAWGDLDHLLDGYDEEQKAVIQRERARRIAEQNKMFASRKLCLVLDIDHTLLNSAKFVEVETVHEDILRKKEEQDREKPQRHLFRFQHMGMWTKLRPGIWNFLEKASKLFEMHLYTMGNKLYATEMAKVLDPTGALFAGRVISRGDATDPLDEGDRVSKIKDLEGVLGMESAVVIIDDSARVWPHNKHNLILVERYTYFPCSRRQFGLPGPSLLEIDRDERPEDGTLASSLSVIERIHTNFFSHKNLNEPDVRNILAGEQKKILSGCKIVFSRIFPVGEVNPHMHPLWQTAEQFGAVCTNQIDESVTHVVAHSLGTDKVNWAISTGRFVVHPGWVEASALLYRRANELDFAVMKI
ncbi:hypothetical protein LUZ60_007896 [Juncus effusus]|nr:hypothetical protein LUZ60_007896 [Juncus effusus]